MFRYAFATLVFRLLALPLVLSSGCFDIYSGSEQLRQAEELTRQERYDEAIAIYRAHMEERLAIEERQEWENPYFYLLLIGDVQLGRGEPAAALEIYQEAEQHKVEAGLISDRYRAVGRWYAEHGQLAKALEVLNNYRDRDSLLFDAMLDRIARQLTAQEEEEAAKAKEKTGPQK